MSHQDDPSLSPRDVAEAALPHPVMHGEAAAIRTSAERRRSLIAVLCSIFAAGLSFGTSIPLLSVLLERRGTDSSLIGLNASMAVLATVLFAPLLPGVVRRFGALPTLFGSIAVMIAAVLLLPVFPSLEAWFPLRFLLGIGMAAHWVLSETWLNAATTARNRGLIAGLYATVISIGFAAGPALLTVIDLDGFLPFLLIAGAMVLAGIPIFIVRHSIPRIEVGVERSSWQVVKLAPVIMAAILVAGIVDSAIMSLLPIYGLRAGLTEAAAVLMLTVAITGSATLQLPLGWAADRISRRSLLMACATAGVLGPALLPHVVGSPLLLWPVLFVWGGTVVGLYTISLAMLGDRFEGGELARANAVFIMLYCVGSILGPPLSGGAMDLFGNDGLVVVQIVVCTAFFLLAMSRRF